MSRLKIKWLRKLAMTRNFVVMTDKEYIINLKGLNPNKLSDIQAVANQLATLEVFREKLSELIDDYEKRVSKAMAVPGGTPKKPAKKIKVKKG